MAIKMKLEDWWFWYDKITETFGFSKDDDQKAADVLSTLTADKAFNLKDIRKKIKGKVAIVFGAGPSLENDIRRVKNLGFHKSYVIISADGATTPLLMVGVVPDVVVTDLDGRIEDIFEAQRRGAIIVVHAHGNNIKTLRKYVTRFNSGILGTTQVYPRPNVYNFGGFTDGDRCVFLSEEFGARLIILTGMDLGPIVGKYSKPFLKKNSKADMTKHKKLKMAEELLSWFSERSMTRIINFTSSGKQIDKIENVSSLNILSLKGPREVL
ncbi:MAG: 6-hydroxymethylpterin diphosphokinase MptE-like protein [Candidatus Bathyarchaeota archaeon]